MNITDYTIAIVENDTGLRQQFRSHFSRSARVHCTLCVDTVDKLLKYHNTSVPIHLLLLDVLLCRQSGMDGLAILRKRLPGTEIIVFSMLEDEATIFKALSKGASGYLVKGDSLPVLEQKITGILEGRESVLSPSISKKLVAYFQKISLPAPLEEVLSVQERVVVRYLVDGLPYDDIAAKMDVTVNGVRYHIKKIYRKLGVNSRYQLICWYYQSGL